METEYKVTVDMYLTVAGADSKADAYTIAFESVKTEKIDDFEISKITPIRVIED